MTELASVMVSRRAPTKRSEDWGAVFAVRVQSLLSFTSVAVQVLWREGHKSRYTKFYRKHWRSRGIGITNLSREQEQIAKNVTNQMTFIVRVRLRFYFFVPLNRLWFETYSFTFF